MHNQRKELNHNLTGVGLGSQQFVVCHLPSVFVQTIRL